MYKNFTEKVQHHKYLELKRDKQILVKSHQFHQILLNLLASDMHIYRPECRNY